MYNIKHRIFFMKFNMSETIAANDLRKRILYVIFILLIYRIGSHIPIPLLNVREIMNTFSEDNIGIFSLFNLFSGGALSKITIFSLGIMPYISASIIIQLLSSVWDPIKNLRKDGEAGRAKISDYTRYLTVLLSTLQAFAMAKYLLSISVINESIFLHYLLIIFTLVSGTLFLVWLGEQINEKGIGNGISLIIFTSIASNIPRTIGSSLDKLRQGEINIIAMIIFLFILVAIIFFIVFVERAQKKIFINYAKRQQGRKMYAAQTTYLPLKINMSGVIPPIFASSIVLFPITLMQWFDQTSGNMFFYNIKSMLLPGKPLYIILFGLAIVFFCFFYTNLIFNSKETSDNLKKSGGFIPGIRPGEQTAIYINKVVNRLTILGAIYLTFVALLPEFLVLFANIPFYFGGTSLLIVVVVIMDFISQVQTKMISYKYDGFMKKYKMKKD